MEQHVLDLGDYIGNSASQRGGDINLDKQLPNWGSHFENIVSPTWGINLDEKLSNFGSNIGNNASPT